jgi:prevent-host-death family protein
MGITELTDLYKRYIVYNRQGRLAAVTSYTASMARNKFADILNLVSGAKERVIIERHDKPVAAVISMEEVQILDALLSAAQDRADVSELVTEVESRRDHVAAVDYLSNACEATELTPESFADVMELIANPRPATPALRELLKADAD